MARAWPPTCCGVASVAPASALMYLRTVHHQLRSSCSQDTTFPTLKRSLRLEQPTCRPSEAHGSSKITIITCDFNIMYPRIVCLLQHFRDLHVSDTRFPSKYFYNTSAIYMLATSNFQIAFRHDTPH